MMQKPNSGWEVLYIDIEGTETSEDFMLKLIEKVDKTVWGKIKSFLINAKDATDELGLSELRIKIRKNLNDDWKSKGDKFFQVS